MKYKARTGDRILEFDGTLIASSSSRKSDSVRWVEFNLYITAGGSYVLERVGQTTVFHALACPIVERNRLKYNPEDILEPYHTECDTCLPDEDYDTVVVERPRYFALVTESPAAILDALHKKDKYNTRYMTYVSQKLIEEAAKHDKRLEKEYSVQHIN